MLDWLFAATPFYFMTQSFWRDEAFSYLMARLPIVQMLQTTAKDFNPPLYYGILHYWMIIFGSSEVAIRSLSLIFFAISIFVFLLFLVDILRIPEKKANVYVVLYALNPFLLYYGIEGRMYSLFALLTLTSFYFMLKKKWGMYVLVTMLGFYCHYFFLFVFLTQVLYTFHYEKNNLKTELKYFLAPFLSFVPWLLYILPTMTTKTALFWTQPLSFSEAINTLGILFTGYESVWMFYNQYILFVSLGILGIILYFIKRPVKRDKHLSLLLMWAFGAYFSIALISFIKPIFVPRYLIFSAVGLNLLLAYIMEHVDRKGKIVIAALVVLLIVHYTHYESLYKRKGDVRTTLHEINTIANVDDVIYVTDPSTYFTASYYIRDKNVYIYQSKEQIPYYIGLALVPPDRITQMLPAYPRKAFILKNDYEYEIISSQ